MIYVPFVYFLLLFLFIYKKHGFDASAYCALLYMVTSFFSIWLSYIEPQYPSLRYVNFLPTVTYCLLLTLFILPVYSFNSNTISKINFSSSKFVKYITVYYFVTFIAFIVAYRNDLIFRFFIGNMLEMKTSYQTGEGLALTRYPVYLEVFLAPMRLTCELSYIMIFIFFYSLAFLKKSKFFNFMAIVGSLSGPLFGMLFIDRSRTFWWIIIAGLSLSIFWRHFNNRSKKLVRKIGIVFGSLIIAYMAVVSIQRFSDTNEGTKAFLIDYAGQSFPIFCQVFEAFENPDGFTGRLIFPATHAFLLQDIQRDMSFQAEMTMRTGMEVGSFYTLLGTMLVGEGPMGIVVLLTLYYILFYKAIGKMHRVISFEKLIVLFFLLIIPSCGCIAYFYTTYPTTLSAIAIIIVMYLMKSRTIQS